MTQTSTYQPNISNNRKGEQEGLQFQTLLIAEALLGLAVGIALLSYVNTGIQYSTTDVVARDLSLTLGAMVSSPYPVTLNYQMNTSSYTMSITPDSVTVLGPETSSRSKIIGSATTSIQPARVRYQPSLLLTSDTSQVSVNDDTSRLSDFCNTLSQTIEENTINVSGTSPLVLDAREALTSSGRWTRANQTRAAVTLWLQEQTRSSIQVKYSNDASEGHQKTACYTAANLRASHFDRFQRISLSKAGLPERMVEVTHPVETKAGQEINKEELITSVIDGMNTGR
jgi:hypothetical protein